MLGQAQETVALPWVSSAMPMMEHHESHKSEEGHDAHFDSLTKRQAYCLFTSHILSMWNSRMYEFGVILFIQASFPGNLTASSINGIAETVCVLLFASALGRWVDCTPSRLRVLLITIVINRISILLSCMTWFVILSFSYPVPKQVFFATALILGMVEKLSRGTNLLSMERDWVPTLANVSIDAKHPATYDLTHLNTTMRRIDMLCKLIAPLAVSTFVFTIESERVAVVVLAAMSILSLGPECWGAKEVWDHNSRLRARKGRVEDTATGSNQDQPMQLCYTKTPSARLAPDLFGKVVLQVMGSIRTYVADLGYYFSTSVWIPSLCAAVPHASVLTFSGTMLTYLLNAGYSLNTITGARAIGAVFEIGSTFIFPWAVGILSTPKHASCWYSVGDYHEVDQREPSSISDASLSETDENHEQCGQSGPIIEHSVIRVGSWALGGLVLSLIPAVLSLFFLDASLHTSITSTSSPHQSPITPYPLNTIILVSSISISLLCRWLYDLCATQLTQTLVPATKRSSFGGTEMSIVSLVSLGHWIAAAVWHTQSDFKWLALGSFAVVAIGVLAYYCWQGWWRRRGRASGERIGEELETNTIL